MSLKSNKINLQTLYFYDHYYFVSNENTEKYDCTIFMLES